MIDVNGNTRIDTTELDRIREALRAKEWTYSLFARKIGYVPSHVSMFMAGNNNVSHRFVAAAKKALGMDGVAA